MEVLLVLTLSALHQLFKKLDLKIFFTPFLLLMCKKGHTPIPHFASILQNVTFLPQHNKNYTKKGIHISWFILFVLFPNILCII